MFKAIENWFRRLIAAEVSKLDTSLRKEREEIHSAAKHLIEVSEHSQENIKLRAHIQQLHAQFAEVRATIEQLHPTTN
jgi:hypothetical protein